MSKSSGTRSTHSRKRSNESAAMTYADMAASTPPQKLVCNAGAMTYAGIAASAPPMKRAHIAAEGEATDVEVVAMVVCSDQSVIRDAAQTLLSISGASNQPQQPVARAIDHASSEKLMKLEQLRLELLEKQAAIERITQELQESSTIVVDPPVQPLLVLPSSTSATSGPALPLPTRTPPPVKSLGHHGRGEMNERTAHLVTEMHDKENHSIENVDGAKAAIFTCFREKIINAKSSGELFVNLGELGVQDRQDLLKAYYNIHSNFSRHPQDERMSCQWSLKALSTVMKDREEGNMSDAKDTLTKWEHYVWSSLNRFMFDAGLTESKSYMTCVSRPYASILAEKELFIHIPTLYSLAVGCDEEVPKVMMRKLRKPVKTVPHQPTKIQKLVKEYSLKFDE